ncbi:hypothetical protein [Vibrio europaeus]|uniref:hypothetical protein n=1 Tax=Vibrio europaeus TaxID=300876 RepID=UPI00148B3E3C|nr:hypothetical protein [Vibrio europaeus]
MALSIQQLHTQVTKLAEQNGDVTGKLKGNVAPNTEGRFQGLKVSNGARDTEKTFATEVLKHASNVILNKNEQAELFNSASRFGKNNFVLHQATGGESRFVGLNSDQLTLRDAKVLLEAAMRQQAPPLPPRGATPPPLPPRSATPPPLPPRSATPPPAGGDSTNNASRKYDQQFILDSGSGKSAEGIALKAKSSALKTQSVSLKSNVISIPDNLKGITFNSRVYIVGHCSPGSSSIVSDKGVRITAQDYAKGIAEAITRSKSEYKGKPLVVSVMACNGGSSSSVLVNNRKEALELRADNSRVDIVWPSSSGSGYGCLPKGSTTLAQAHKISNYNPDDLHDSFAEKLTQELSELGIVAEVKGRTNVVGRTSESKLQGIRDGVDTFSKKVNGRHHVEGDKVGFIAQGGNINKVVYDYK